MFYWLFLFGTIFDRSLLIWSLRLFYVYKIIFRAFKVIRWGFVRWGGWTHLISYVEFLNSFSSVWVIIINSGSFSIKLIKSWIRLFSLADLFLSFLAECLCYLKKALIFRLIEINGALHLRHKAPSFIFCQNTSDIQSLLLHVPQYFIYFVDVCIELSFGLILKQNILNSLSFIWLGRFVKQNNSSGITFGTVLVRAELESSFYIYWCCNFSPIRSGSCLEIWLGSIFHNGFQLVLSQECFLVGLLEILIALCNCLRFTWCHNSSRCTPHNWILLVRREFGFRTDVTWLHLIRLVTDFIYVNLLTLVKLFQEITLLLLLPLFLFWLVGRALFRVAHVRLWIFWLLRSSPWLNWLLCWTLRAFLVRELILSLHRKWLISEFSPIVHWAILIFTRCKWLWNGFWI